MKKFGTVLLILIVAFSAYLAWSYFSVSGPDTASAPPAKSGSHKLSQNGKSASNLQADILSAGEKQIDAAKSLVAQIPSVLNNSLNNLLDQTKNAIKDKIDPLLQTTSSPAFQSAPQSISPSTGTASEISQNPLSEPSVCSVVSKGTAVGYEIEQPFSGSQGTSYKIDWGDGEAASGVFQSGAQNISVSHSYAQQGDYSVIFRLISDSTTLTASRSVCVK